MLFQPDADIKHIALCYMLDVRIWLKSSLKINIRISLLILKHQLRGGAHISSGGGATGPTILFTAAISSIFFTGADPSKHEPHDRPTQCGSVEQKLVVRQFVP